MPVELPTLSAFALTVAAIVVSPGPDTMLILRYAVGAGAAAGLAAVLGVQIGLIIHTVLAAAGVSALIASSPVLFKSLALAGALYLGWLGIQGFRGSPAPAPALAPALAAGAPPRAAGARTACRDAILTNVLNPKVLVLFFALYPNFLVPDTDNVTVQLLVLSAVLIVINVAWQAPLALSADLARRWLLRPRVQGVIARLTGSILLLFALLMLYEHVL
jgi:threonine/homoserine/homoserine lactone efflux protein